MANIVPLNNEVHKNLRLKGLDVAHVSGENIIPVTAHEIPLIGSELPIVFIKNSETGQFLVGAITGLQQGENLFVEGSKWLGDMVPTAIGSYPFKLIPTDQTGENLTVGIDMDSSMVSETEGERLFDDAGELTPFLSSRKDALMRYFEEGRVTSKFVQDLVNKGLIVDRQITIDVNGAQQQLNGLYFVDEAKLSALPDAEFMELRQSGYLPVIYAHLGSMHHLRALVKRKAQQA